MKDAEDKLDFGLVLVLLRTHPGVEPVALAQESGIDKGLIAAIERGLSSPSGRPGSGSPEAFDVELSFLDELVPFCRSLRARLRGRAAGRTARSRRRPRSAQRSGREGHRRRPGGDGAVPPGAGTTRRRARPPRRRPGLGQRAVGRPGAAPAERPGPGRPELLRGRAELGPGGADLRGQSDRSAPQRGRGATPGTARRRLAQAAPGPETWRLRLLGFCELFRGQCAPCQRNSLTAAREAFARADELWAAGRRRRSCRPSRRHPAARSESILP